jgi:CubicO group peptidase (beta-lactamase class C family)
MRLAENPPNHHAPRRWGWRRLITWLLIALGTITVVYIGTIGIAAVIYPPQYVWRLVLWGTSDVGDVERFPARALHAAASPQRLERVDATDEVRRAFAANKNGAVLETFLQETGTQAFVVLRGGKVIYERYFNGAGRETLVTSFSAAKSIVSLLIGIALAERKIDSVDDPITRYLPELAARDARFGAITIRHLLRMASGIRYEESHFFNGDDAKTYYYPDLRTLALQQTRVEATPGARFHYNNYHPLLLGIILERATGIPVTSYLQEKLWTPLGMEYDGSWSLDSEASGLEKLESGVNARAIDFAKLGLLMLHAGRHNGTQILPADWVRDATAPPHAPPAGYHPDQAWMSGEPDLYYGYMWWGLDKGGGRYDFTAHGKYGQFIFVSPANDVVIVRNGSSYGVPAMQWLRTLSALAVQLNDQVGKRPRE